MFFNCDCVYMYEYISNVVLYVKLFIKVLITKRIKILRGFKTDAELKLGTASSVSH